MYNRHNNKRPTRCAFRCADSFMEVLLRFCHRLLMGPIEWNPHGGGRYFRNVTTDFGVDSIVTFQPPEREGKQRKSLICAQFE